MTVASRMLVAILILELLLKGIQVTAEGWELRSSPQIPSGADVTRPTLKRQLFAYTLRRRLDDAYFWMFVALLQASLRMGRVVREVGNQGQKEASKHNTARMFVGATVGFGAIYFLFAYLEPGTVFAVYSRELWTSQLARCCVIGVQWVEAIACNCLAIVAALMIVRVAHRVLTSNAVLRGRIQEILLIPLTWFSLYFVASQVLTGASLTYDEITAATGAIVIYASPFLFLYISSGGDVAEGFSRVLTSDS